MSAQELAKPNEENSYRSYANGEAFEQRIAVLKNDGTPQEKEAAFSSIMVEYSEKIYRIALLMTHSVDVAEVVLQETFLAVWQRAAQCRAFDTEELYGWISQIARNKVLDILRSNKKGPVLADNIELSWLDEGSDPRMALETASWAEEPFIIYSAKDERKMVKNISSQKRKNSLGLFLLGYNYTDIQRILSEHEGQPIVPGTVASRINKARGDIEKSL